MAVIKSLPATKSLSNQLKYLENEGKTVEELKEGINCTTDNVEREFNIVKPVSYTHLTLPTIQHWCRSRWSPYH